MDEIRARLDAVLNAPERSRAYERWVAEQPNETDDYLFASARVRFRALDEDVPIVPGDLKLVARKDGCELASPSLGGSVLMIGLDLTQLERVLARIDGRRTVAELKVSAGRHGPVFERLLSQTLGLISFVPGAVASLEMALPGTEIVRFPGSPYELVRAYWSNMAEVRQLAERSLEEFSGSDPLGLLRSLHVVSLLGADLQTFYRPASRIARTGVRPGVLYDTEPVHVNAGSSRLLLAGPRIGVGFVGGERYHQLLAERAGDPGSLLPERAIEVEGIDWGQVLTGRAAGETRDAPWFCPPRPLTDAHFHALFSAYSSALAAAAGADRARLIRDLAHFHYRFVRLHPFRCANQSLAMNLVNLVLRRVRGAGMPHLLLDQLALRLDEAAFARVFELAADEYTIQGEPRERWRLHREKKSRVYGLIQALQRTPNISDADRLVGADVAAARAALILD
jgi:hypothetical protein